MEIMDRTLGELLGDPRIRPIAADAIKGRDLSKEEIWHSTLRQLKEAHFGGGMAAGFERLFAAADSGDWFYPLYPREALEKDSSGEGTSLVFFPSAEGQAGERPWILLVPGGGFVNVWNLTEGWPVAAQFNRLGYHVFILTYRVEADGPLLDREMEDMARAIELVRENGRRFGVRWDRYIPCGFSAGGYLVCLWNTAEKGYAAHGLPKPEAVFPIYPLTSWKLCLGEDGFDPGDSQRLFGCDLRKAAASAYEIPEHAEGFPPCALFLAAGDTLVDPEHSRLLAGALEKRGIPCLLEIGPEGGHGFADGEGMCMEGWTERAVRWAEKTRGGI
ncbi:MAG: alpha/beta hydrolase [Clostridiales bacterium]|nr:alpha/beta hydrolase [Clostridiales bacterium]